MTRMRPRKSQPAPDDSSFLFYVEDLNMNSQATLVLRAFVCGIVIAAALVFISGLLQPEFEKYSLLMVRCKATL